MCFWKIIDGIDGWDLHLVTSTHHNSGSVPLTVYSERRGCDVSLCSLLDSGVSGVRGQERQFRHTQAQNAKTNTVRRPLLLESPSKDTAGQSRTLPTAPRFYK